MARTRSLDKSHLGDSWVVDGSDGSEASLEEDARQVVPPRKTKASKPAALVSSSATRRRSSRASSAVPEPELIMPSLHVDNMDGSWTVANGESQQARKRLSKSNVQTQARATRKQPLKAFQTTKDFSNISTTPNFTDDLLEILSDILHWILDILGGTLKTLKRPISWVLAIYVFAGLVTLVQNLLTSSIYSALSPICRIPGTSLLDLPMCRSPVPMDSPPTLPGPAEPIEFSALMKTQSHFEEILAESASGVSLPLDMKRGETSIRDLRQIVRFSSLSSRNELVLEFDNFIETSRIASYDLQKFNSHVGRAVDNVLATARWTQRVLDDMSIAHSTRGYIPSFISERLLAPFQPIQFTESRLPDQYIQHTRIISDEIETLISEAQALLQVLQNLEDRLDVIHGIALRSSLSAQTSKDEVLSQLWTLLGGNRAQLGKFNSQLKLLRDVGEYRKIAWAHVSSTILKLQAMGAELEELRERVGAAAILRDRPDIPLAVHLESIRLGVERLESGRDAAREVERNHLRRVLERGEDAERQMKLVDA